MTLSTHRAKIAHLLRRTGFTCSNREIDALESLSIPQIVERLLQVPNSLPTPPMKLDESERNALPYWWLETILQSDHPLLEKMTIFWHGHFTSAMHKCRLDSLAKQNDLLRRYAFGNFRELTYELSIDPAMMLWLDNHLNSKKAPNENYARELMELFTLGIGNYSEKDVDAVSRAMTGWIFLDYANLVVGHSSGHFDDSTKTILGKTGKFGVRETVDILVEHPACAKLIATKLWNYFAYPKPEPQLIDQLASVFRKNKYNIKALLRAIFTSEQFYSDRAYMCLVKNPIEYMVWALAQFPGLKFDQQFVAPMRPMGQTLFDPPHVAGWPDGAAWLATSMLFARYQYAETVTLTAAAYKQIQMPQSTDKKAMLDELIEHLGLHDLSAETRTQMENFVTKSAVSRDVLVQQTLHMLMVTPEAQIK